MLQERNCSWDVTCTVLLLAYFNGNASLCRAIVKVGARLGIVNRDGLSIFNAPVATKQLLFKLLGMFAGEIQCKYVFRLSSLTTALDEF